MADTARELCVRVATWQRDKVSDKEAAEITYVPETQAVSLKYFPFQGGNYQSPMVAIKVFGFYKLMHSAASLFRRSGVNLFYFIRHNVTIYVRHKTFYFKAFHENCNVTYFHDAELKKPRPLLYFPLTSEATTGG